MIPQYDLLIVDDDPTQIVVLGAMLRPFGQVRFAKRGADALRLARQSIPDLMLLDLQLPDLDGVAVLGEMRRSPLLAGVPVVVLSGTDAGQAGLSVGGLGVAACLEKPPDGPAVAACVQAQLQLALRRLAQRRPRGSGEPAAACNRRSFDLLLALACQDVPREGPLALLRLAPAGADPACCDAVGLERLAQAVRAAARRPADCIGHLGTDGLALLLPDTDARGAACITRQLLHGPAGLPGLAAGFVVLQAAEGPGVLAPSMLMGAAESALQAARAAGAGQARQVAWQPGVGASRPLPVPGLDAGLALDAAWPAAPSAAPAANPPGTAASPGLPPGGAV